MTKTSSESKYLPLGENRALFGYPIAVPIVFISDMIKKYLYGPFFRLLVIVNKQKESIQR